MVEQQERVVEDAIFALFQYGPLTTVEVAFYTSLPNDAAAVGRILENDHRVERQGNRWWLTPEGLRGD